MISYQSGCSMIYEATSHTLKVNPVQKQPWVLNQWPNTYMRKYFMTLKQDFNNMIYDPLSLKIAARFQHFNISTF